MPLQKDQISEKFMQMYWDDQNFIQKYINDENIPQERRDALIPQLKNLTTESDEIALNKAIRDKYYTDLRSPMQKWVARVFDVPVVWPLTAWLIGWSGRVFEWLTWSTKAWANRFWSKLWIRPIETKYGTIFPWTEPWSEAQKWITEWVVKAWLWASQAAFSAAFPVWTTFLWEASKTEVWQDVFWAIWEASGAVWEKILPDALLWRLTEGTRMELTQAIPMFWIPLIAKAIKISWAKAAPFIKKSALDDVSKAINPTKEAAKANLESIAPEFIRRKIVWTLETIEDIAETWRDIAWKKLGDFIERADLKWSIKANPIINWLAWEQSKTIVKWIVVDPQKYCLINKLWDIILNIGDELPANYWRALRIAFDDIINRKKWFDPSSVDKLDISIQKPIANEIRKQLAKENPELAQLNKDFHFYETLYEVTKETIKRKRPQSGKLQKLFSTSIGAWFAWWTWSPLAAIWAYMVSENFINFISSTLFKTLKAQSKNKLADLLIEWDISWVNALINTLQTTQSNE